MCKNGLKVEREMVGSMYTDWDIVCHRESDLYLVPSRVFGRMHLRMVETGKGVFKSREMEKRDQIERGNELFLPL
jgi:hypothetical protein